MTDRIIILGGSGFLGARLINALQKAGFGQVACGDVIFNKKLECDYVYLDLLNKNSLIDILDNYDVIINCIGQITNPFNLCFKLNSDGINNLVNASVINNNCRLIHVSTVAVYGSIKECNEESPLNPETSYATAKAFAEKTIIANYLHKQFTILRLTNLYGEDQLKGIFAYLIRSYNSDRILNFNNDGSLTRSFMHVDDCADLIVEVVRNRNMYGIYNIKGHETYSVIALVQEFEKRFNVTFEKFFSKDLPWENIDKLDDSKLRSLINIKPRWNLFSLIEKEIKSEIYA